MELAEGQPVVVAAVAAFPVEEEHHVRVVVGAVVVGAVVVVHRGLSVVLEVVVEACRTTVQDSQWPREADMQLGCTARWKIAVDCLKVRLGHNRHVHLHLDHTRPAFGPHHNQTVVVQTAALSLLQAMLVFSHRMPHRQLPLPVIASERFAVSVVVQMVAVLGCMMLWQHLQLQQKLDRSSGSGGAYRNLPFHMIVGSEGVVGFALGLGDHRSLYVRLVELDVPASTSSSYRRCLTAVTELVS